MEDGKPPQPGGVIFPTWTTLVKRPRAQQVGHRFHVGESPGPPDFSEVIDLFHRYRQRQQAANDVNIDWIFEAEKRLDQAAMIVDSVEAMLRRDRRLNQIRQAQPDEAKRARLRELQYRRARHIELACEMFYYVAFRFQIILRDTLKVGYDPVGIRDVRNQLIEHPEGNNSRASGQSFLYGNDLPWGPIIKPFGPRATPGFHDDGLYVNARQAIDRLRDILLRLLPGEAET
jgi:hypothetical protein